MKKLIPLIILLLSVSNGISGSNTEFRATWIVTWDLYNQYLNESDNKKLCRTILDSHVTANMNAILWHARQSGTAYYDSDIEPWGYYAGGSYPGYDIFKYAVQEAHKRGMEIHPWFNTFHCSSTASGAPAAEHPEWICTNEDGKFMTSKRCLSPGIAAVREYLVSVAMELVRKYDIDGIHFDFIRWSEYDEDDMRASLSKEEEFSIIDGYITEERIRRLTALGTKRYIYDVEHPYSEGVPEGFETWADWRRWCVTEFVRVFNDSAKAVKPWVRVSVAALGRYNWDLHIGWDGYNTVFQDAALWYNKGYIDQLMPMHYHWLYPESFYNILAGPYGDSSVNTCWGYFIQKGITDGRLYSCGPASWLLKDYNLWDNHLSIVNKAREVEWVDGFQFYSYTSWHDNDYWEEAKQKIFPGKAKIRATGLIDSIAPEPPTIEVGQLDTLLYRISVHPPESGEQPSWFAIYRSREDSIDRNSSEIIEIIFDNDDFIYDDYLDIRYEGGYFYYGVTALDRYWNESQMSNIARTDSVPAISIKPLPVTLQYIKKLTDGYEMQWLASGEADLKGYRIYGKLANEDWQLLLDESTLSETATNAIVSPDISNAAWLFVVRAVGLGPESIESDDSDIYGVATSAGERILVIDAFDRTTGGWQQPTHPFTERVCQSLGRLCASYDCAANEAVDERLIEPDDYIAVIWLSGDESDENANITLNEMSLLVNYLRYGGQLLMSGSNIGYGLELHGDSHGIKFFNEYLKSKFLADGNNGNGYQVNGDSEGIFSNLSFNFDDGSYGFNIINPDIYDTTNGSISCFRYANGDSIAAVQFEGKIISNSFADARLISLGFPFEAIYEDAQLDSFLLRTLNFFNVFGDIGISDSPEKPENYRLVYSYPNPFNSATIIQYVLAEPSVVKVEIYNTIGQRVATLINKYENVGLKRIQWKPDNHSSGVYYYHLSVSGKNEQFKKISKMIYLK